MPIAVAKAANALKHASMMVDVLIDLDVANLRAFEMAAVAAAVVFDSVASW